MAFYGDPAWSATMAPGPLAWDQTLHENGGRYELEIIPRRGEKTFETINNNGSQRGGRPIVELLRHRIKAASVKIVEGADLQPVITGNFMLVPRRTNAIRNDRIESCLRPIKPSWPNPIRPR